MSRKDAIVAAAVDLFAAQGYHATPTAELARRAGVSEGSIFYYFPTKEEILMHILQEAMANYLESVRKVLEDAPSGIAALEGFVRNHLAGAQLHPRTTKILVRDFPLGLLEPGSPHHAKIQPLFAELGDLLLAIIQRGQADGTIIAGSPPALALLLRSTTVGLSRLLLLLGAGQPGDGMEELVTCCRRAFSARP